MKVALYQPWIYQRGGMERVILEITSPSSTHDWTIFTSHYSPATTFGEFRKRKVVEVGRVSVKRSPKELVEAAIKISSQKLPLDGFDALLVSTAGFGEFIALRNHSLPLACFCHTPLRVIHDEAARNEFLSRTSKHFLPAFLAFEAAYKLLEKRAWKHFAKITCNSGETKRRLLRAGVAGEDKLSVVHPGVSLAMYRPSWKFEKYFLAPGRISKLKNIELAINSFKQFRQASGRPAKEFRLVAAGAVGEKDGNYLHQLRQLAGGDASIVFETNVSERRLQSLYSRCYAVLFTALNEDWGIVPLEAMAFGKPVVAVDEGGPRESVVHRKTGFLLPANAASFSRAMQALAADSPLTKRMGKAGRERVKQFDWKQFVKGIDEMVEDAAAGR